MAKAANGTCDNLLTCILRAWDFAKPLLVAPAMNAAMWDHPTTTEHLARLKSFGYRVIDPVRKTLACGDEGIGAMAEVVAIARALQREVQR